MPSNLKYTKEMLESIVPCVQSWAALLAHFQKKPTGGNYNAFKQRCLKFSVNTSHFKGQGWSKGLTCISSNGVSNNKKSNGDVLRSLKNGTACGLVKAIRLKEFLLESGKKYECSNCHLTDWFDKPISLDIDHINGTNTDQRIENLRFLCPNCHRQTPTWGNKKRL